MHDSHNGRVLQASAREGPRRQGGVPIPHDTELHPVGSGSPVTIYGSLPPNAEAQLFEVPGIGGGSGIVMNPDGSTLDVGQVIFTSSEAVATIDLPGADPGGLPRWPIPAGALLRPDGGIMFVQDGAMMIYPATTNMVVLNSDGTTTTLHPPTAAASS